MPPARPSRAPFQAKDGGIPVIVVPEGYKVEDIERYLDFPARARAVRIKAETPDAFIAYFKPLRR